MIGLRRSARVDHSPISRVLTERLRRPTAYAAGVNGTVTFDAGPDEAWTIRLRNGAGSLESGRARSPTATVSADAETLHAVIEGRVSGLDAFFDKKLGVRGHVGLALKLDLFFPPGIRPDAYVFSL